MESENFDPKQIYSRLRSLKSIAFTGHVKEVFLQNLPEYEGTNKSYNTVQKECLDTLFAAPALGYDEKKDEYKELATSATLTPQMVIDALEQFKNNENYESLVLNITHAYTRTELKLREEKDIHLLR